MSGHGPVVGLGRALGDHDHVAQLTLADVALDAGLGPAQGPAAAQARRELFAQGASALDEERWSMVSCDPDRSERMGYPRAGVTHATFGQRWRPAARLRRVQP